MGHIDGIQSYEAVRGRAASFETDGKNLLAASLDDINRSKPPSKNTGTASSRFPS
jgi:hypothetical protein